MSWSEYFPQAEPPEAILRLVDEGWAEDISEPRADAPWFGFMFPDGALVWLMSFEENPDDRVEPGGKRFLIWINDPEQDRDGLYDYTDDVEEAVEAYKDAVQLVQKRFPGEGPNPKAWSPGPPVYRFPPTMGAAVL